MLDVILLYVAKVVLILLLAFVAVLLASGIWYKGGKLIKSVRYYFEWRPSIYRFVQWQQGNPNIVHMSDEGKSKLIEAVDYLDDRYQLLRKSDAEFVADELVRQFELPTPEEHWDNCLKSKRAKWCFTDDTAEEDYKAGLVAMGKDPEATCTFMFVEKSFWEKEKHVPAVHLGYSVRLPFGSEIGESVFEFEGDKDKIREQLICLGYEYVIPDPKS